MPAPRQTTVAQSDYTSVAGEIRWWRMCGRLVKKDNGQVAVYLDALPVNFDGFLAAMTPNPDYQRQVGEDT